MERVPSAAASAVVAPSGLLLHPRPSAATPIARLFADDDAEPPPSTAGQIEDHAAEIVRILRSIGAKLVCIDFDATLVRVHTGGAWTRSAQELYTHVRPLFLALVPRLVHIGVHVAVVTFSPQMQLIRQVLALSFPVDIAQRLILRCDDASWQLAHADATGFAPLWQTGGRHLDRTCKLPFVISAALQASNERHEIIRNRDTVLFDDDAANIRVVNDSGITGIYFDPQLQTNYPALLRQIRRFAFAAAAAASTSAIGGGGIVPSVSSHLPPPSIPMTPVRTPSKQPTARMVRLMGSPEGRFITTSSASGTTRAALHARHRGHGSGSGSGAAVRISRFHLCTPSPVMKLRSTVDMGRPRSKRSIRLMRNIETDLQELHLPGSTNITAIGGLPSQFRTTPTKLSMNMVDPLPAVTPTTPPRRSRSRSPLQF